MADLFKERALGQWPAMNPSDEFGMIWVFLIISHLGIAASRIQESRQVQTGHETNCSCIYVGRDHHAQCTPN